MSEKRLNTILYIILAIVVLLYVYFNVVTVLIPHKAADNRIQSKKLFDVNNTENEMEMLRNISFDFKQPENQNMGSQEESSLNEDDVVEDESSVVIQERNAEEKRMISKLGYLVYIDLDLTQMFVYSDGELIKTYEVSGGKPSTPSPVGTWKIISKDTWGEGFGGAWLGFNVPWGMYGIHGTTEPWFIGKNNTSQGCIRMKNDEVKELYELIPYNTVVTIVYENRPFYPMQDGNVGSDVLAVERALKSLGYYNGSEDGIFGELLQKAVKEFQKDYKLYVTGIINITTYELIMEMENEIEE